MDRRSWNCLMLTLILLSYGALLGWAAPKSVLRISLLPTEAVLKPGETIQFDVQARTAQGREVDLKAARISWQVVGKVGTITETGLFTAAEQPGRGLVRVIVRTKNARGVAHALVKVGDVPTPGLTRRVEVLITPNVATVPPGGTQQFSVDLRGDVSWRVIPSRIGTITPTGLFVASQNQGRGIVIATVRTDKGIGTARANVYVGQAEKSHRGFRRELSVIPQHARIQPGESVTFTVRDMGGQEKPPAVPYVWNVTPSHLGKLTPIPPDQAVFTAGDRPGRALVTASFRTDVEVGMGWAMVDIGQMRGGPHPMRMPALVKVRPEDVTLDIGETVFFQIEGNVNGQPLWSVMPSQLGKIDANGVFTPLTPGWGLVIAKVQTEAGISVGQARVFVGAARYTPLRVTVSPSTLQIDPESAPIPLKVQVTTAKGEAVPKARLFWQVFPSHLGSVDANGVFTPGPHPVNGIITVIARTETGSGTAQVRVIVGTAQGAMRLRLLVSVAGPTRLKVGAPAQFTVRASTMHRNELDLAQAQIRWRVIPGTLGTLTGEGVSVTFTPGQKGRGVLIAEVTTAEGTGTGRISIIVE